MFPTFFGFELRYWLRGFMVYVFTLILGVLVFAATQSDNIQIGGALENSFRNAPYNVQNFYAIMGLLSSLMVAAFVNSAATREFQHDTDQLLFTKPLSKLGFLLGRFLGSTLVAVLPLLGVSLGILLASCMPWNEPERWGPTVWPAHLWGILCFALPNTLLIGAIVFAIAVYTRSTIASFIGVLGLLVGYAVSQNLLADLDYQRIAGLLDPFGLRVFGLETRYWTPAERNTSYLTLTGDLLWNGIGRCPAASHPAASHPAASHPAASHPAARDVALVEAVCQPGASGLLEHSQEHRVYRGDGRWRPQHAAGPVF
ncbi:MAG: ABC transporter permease [Blastopirellula sp.]|nr:ABC transporter permease [Blastopirellula sp.]